jgi:hypothetical protein
MSAILLAQALAYLRPQFTRAEVEELRPYGGEFTVAEIGAVSYTCPAILVTVLGWSPMHDSKRLQGRHVRLVRMAAFVAVKDGDRVRRLAGAQALAEKLAMLIKLWTPDCTGLAEQLAPMEPDDSPAAENLYGRAIDLKGQALWLVSWAQCVKPAVPLPALVDLLTVEITDIARQGTAPAAGGDGSAQVTVTDEVRFGGPI